MLGAPTVNCNRQVGIGSTPTANLKHYKPPSLRSEALPSDYEPLSERKLFLLRDYKRPSECAGFLLRDNKRQSECARFLLIGNRRPLGRKVHHPWERGRPRPHLWLARMPVFQELAEKIRKVWELRAVCARKVTSVGRKSVVFLVFSRLRAGHRRRSGLGVMTSVLASGRSSRGVIRNGRWSRV